MLKSKMADIFERIGGGNRKIRAIHWLCKLFRNFHSSTVLLCLCVQEESHGRRRPQPPLAELTPPSPPSPAPPLQVGLLFGRARDEPVGVWAREPGSLPRAGLDRVVPHVPGPGRAENGPWRLLLQRTPLSHTAWDPAGAYLLSAASQVKRDRTNSNSTERILKATEPASYWSWSDSGPCYRDAVWLLLLLWFLWAGLCVVWYLCVFLHATLCWFMIARKECERRDKRGRRHTRNLSQDCTAAFKVTELNCKHTGSTFFYLISLSNWFSDEKLHPASLGNDFTCCVLSSKQVMLQLTQTYLVWWVLFEGGKELWQTVLLSRRKDSNYAEARCQLFHSFVCLFMCVCYSTSPTRPHQWLLHGDGSILMFVWGQSEALFLFCCWLSMWETKGSFSQLSQNVLSSNIFPPPSALVTLLCHFSTSLLCFFWQFLLGKFLFWGYCTSCFFFLFLYLAARLSLDFMLFKYYENIRLGRGDGWKQQF